MASHEKVDNTTVTLIQFSGIKPFEKNYNPGSGGADEHTGLKLYSVDIAPTKINNALSQLAAQTEHFAHLDGNGQLFLCLQDISMENFQNQIAKASDNSEKRKPILIVVTDDEWDIKHLKCAPEFGSGTATDEGVCKVRTFLFLFLIQIYFNCQGCSQCI